MRPSTTPRYYGKPSMTLPNTKERLVLILQKYVMKQSKNHKLFKNRKHFQ